MGDNWDAGADMMEGLQEPEMADKQEKQIARELLEMNRNTKAQQEDPDAYNAKFEKLALKLALLCVRGGV